MTHTNWRIGGRLVAAAWVALAASSPAVAGAVPPPTVDETRLPPATPPAPTMPTQQTGACHTGIRTSDGSGGPLKSAVMESVWRLSRGAGQMVAVIDTGVARHRLLPRLIPGGDYVSTGDGTQDCDGHGTIVAGIIGAAHPQGDSDGFGGIAPDVDIIAFRQSSNAFRPADAPGETGVGDVDTLAAAVRAAADAGASVINISSVACLPADQDVDDRSLGAALAYAVDAKNAVVVTAAGNVGGRGQCTQQNPGPDPARPGQPDWATVRTVVSPAWYDDYVLTVGSVDREGRPSAFTLAGPWVDVAAPGEDAVSLSSDGEGLIDAVDADSGPAPISGTSYAAPVVTGVVALVRAASPHLTARQVMRRLEETARHPSAGWDPWVGSGTVDALAAVSADGARPMVEQEPTTQARTQPSGTDPGSRRIALIGAAGCLAIATVAMTATTRSANRSRRGPDPVSGD